MGQRSQPRHHQWINENGKGSPLMCWTLWFRVGMLSTTLCRISKTKFWLLWTWSHFTRFWLSSRLFSRRAPTPFKYSDWLSKRHESIWRNKRVIWHQQCQWRQCFELFYRLKRAKSSCILWNKNSQTLNGSAISFILDLDLLLLLLMLLCFFNKTSFLHLKPKCPFENVMTTFWTQRNGPKQRVFPENLQKVLQTEFLDKESSLQFLGVSFDLILVGSRSGKEEPHLEPKVNQTIIIWDFKTTRLEYNHKRNFFNFLFWSGWKKSTRKIPRTPSPKIRSWILW